MGQFEDLMKGIETEVANAEGGWSIDEERNRLVVHQTVSRDPCRSNNGGEYNYYKIYSPGLGVDATETWSCDIAPRSQYGGVEEHFDCIVSLDGLGRMAQLAEVTTAARAWLAKEPGCMARLKKAIRALS